MKPEPYTGSIRLHKRLGFKEEFEVSEREYQQAQGTWRAGQRYALPSHKKSHTACGLAVWQYA
jgi:hypothetical protein